MLRLVLVILLVGVVLALAHWGLSLGPGVDDACRPGPESEGARPPTLTGSTGPGARAVTRRPRLVSLTGRAVDADGRAVEGATVWVVPSGSSAGPDVRVVGRTDPDGTFSVEVPEDHDGLLLGFSDGQRIQVPSPGEGGVLATVALSHVRTLEGIVRDHAGEPVRDARIEVWGHPLGSVKTRSREDGSFGVPVSAEDEFTLRAEGFDRGRFTRYGLYWAEDTRLEIDLPAVFTIRGRIVHEAPSGDRVGVAGVRVVAWAWEHAYYGGRSAHGGIVAGDGVVSGADGRFTYPGVVRCQELRIHSEDWYLLAGSAEWEPPEEAVLVVQSRTVVAGKVVDEEDRPVPHAEVRCRATERYEKTRETRADSLGRFRLPGLATGRSGVCLEAVAGVHRGRIEISDGAGGDLLDLTLQVTRTRSLRGRLVTAGGRPVQGATVAVDWRAEGEDRGAYCFRRDETDEHGDFVLAGLPGRPLVIDVRAEDLQDREVEAASPTHEGTDLGTIVLQPVPTRTFVVRVVDEQGAAIPEALVEGKAVDRYGERKLAIEDGIYVWLDVEAPGFVSRSVKKHAAGPEEGWRVVLGRAHRIEGRVIDIGGKPICAAEIRHRGSKTTSNLAGRFRLDVVGEGPYEIHTWDLFHKYPVVVARVGGGEILIQAVVPSTVSGRVVDPSGRGIAGITIFADPEGIPDRSLDVDTTDEEGRFLIEDLVGKTFCVWASDDDLMKGGWAARRLSGVRAFAEDVTIEAVAARTITGTVYWPDGRPAGEVDVQARPVGHAAGRGSAETDADGTFTVGGLAPGKYRLEAWTCVDLDEEGEMTSDFEADAGEVEAGRRGLRVVLRVAQSEDE